MRMPWIRVWPLLALQWLTACTLAPTNAGSAVAAPSDPAVLTAYHWQLREARDAQGQPAPDWLPARPPETVPQGPARGVQLDFSQGHVTIGRLCNTLRASYQVNGQAMDIGPVVGTMRLCMEASGMALERRIGQRLPQTQRWSVSRAAPEHAPLLTLFFQDGGQWLLDGDPTDATRYGSAGEHIFLEVAPQHVACVPERSAGQTCLQVRRIEYSDQGLRTATGPWENFAGTIRGYVHQPGVRTVLRIQRYPLPVAPGDTPTYAHVLDMTVESEIVR